LEHLRLSSQFAIDSGDLVEQTLIHVMRSVALWRKGDKEAGLAAIRTGYESARKLDQFGPQARLAIDLAMHHVELEHAVEATILARACRLLPPPWDTDTGIALLVLGKAARQRGDREQAMMYLRQAIEGFDEVDRFSRADALAELAETYVDAGNHELARSTFLAAGRTYSADPNRQFDFNHIQQRLADLDAPVGA
jgi:tetratricopeptide (TPR) repeat protein